MIVIKNAEAYAPEQAGVLDIVLAGSQIVAMGKNLEIPSALVEAVVDAQGLTAVPGFIDGHVHAIGGGGEGGFATRTPELNAGTAFRYGITTIIGVLGTDGIARSMETLVAKTYGLRAEGLSAFCLSGSYRVPLTTLTGELVRDIMFIEPVLGAGEIALGDHRSSWPTDDELIRIIADARLGGILSGKAGLVNIHLGDDSRGFDQLERIFGTMSIPRRQVLPTHCNRTHDVFKQAGRWLAQGGCIDLTATETTDQLSAGKAFYDLCKSFVPLAIVQGHAGSGKERGSKLEGGASDSLNGDCLHRITITSDAQGSLPRFNEKGECIGLDVGTNRALLKALQEAVLKYGIPLEHALLPITQTPAELYKLSRKGRLEVSMDADIVLMNSALEPVTVYAQGALVYADGELKKKGTFE